MMGKPQTSAELMRRFREVERITQEEAAARLNVARSQISEYESSTREPPPEVWIKMGNASPYPDCLAYYEKAGVELKRLTQAARGVQKLVGLVRRWEPAKAELLERALAALQPDEQLGYAVDFIDQLPPWPQREAEFLRDRFTGEAHALAESRGKNIEPRKLTVDRVLAKRDLRRGKVLTVRPTIYHPKLRAEIASESDLKPEMIINSAKHGEVNTYTITGMCKVYFEAKSGKLIGWTGGPKAEKDE